VPLRICQTCGIQYADSADPPARCVVCEDERQYVGPGGPRPAAALAGGCDGRGALLSGDIVQVVADRRWVSFMYSYPNLIHSRRRRCGGWSRSSSPTGFERVYGAWRDRIVEDGKGAVRRSAERYAAALEE
jgi:hypothetical protein